MQINAETRISTSFHTNYELVGLELTAEKKCLSHFPYFPNTNSLNIPKMLHGRTYDIEFSEGKKIII